MSLYSIKSFGKYKLQEVGKIEKYPVLCNRCAEVIEEVEAQK